MTFFSRNIYTALEGIPPAVTVVALKIGASHVKGHCHGFLALEMDIPYKRDTCGACPEYTQDYAVESNPG